eukprot:7107849-Ditylum_brightwellii.AAC.3
MGLGHQLVNLWKFIVGGHATPGMQAPYLFGPMLLGEGLVALVMKERAVICSIGVEVVDNAIDTC